MSPFLIDDPRRTLQDNPNYLRGSSYIFQTEMFPGTDFTCTAVSGAGGIMMPVSEVSTEFRRYSTVPSGGVGFDDLDITFNVNEDLMNYYGLHKWIQINGISGQHHEIFTKEDEEKLDSNISGFSIGYVFIIDSSNRKTFRIKFSGLFPYRLTPLNLAVETNNSSIVSASARFKYQKVKFDTYLIPNEPERRLESPVPLSDYWGYDKAFDKTPPEFGLPEPVSIEDLRNPEETTNRVE